MHAMPAPLEIYEQLSVLSTRMVEAARTNDWERLIDLERSVVQLRNTLMQESDMAAENSEETERRRTLIRRILEDDAEVRRHTEPWMEQVRRLLTGNAKKGQADRAYGTSR